MSDDINKTTPFFSVIIPVYKTENYLSECVDSVLKQTSNDYEIILVDDGSPDNSGKLCDNYSSKYNCVRTIHRKNGGLSAARNTGLLEANGKYILFLDSDDYLMDIRCFDILKEKALKRNYDFLLFKSLKYFDNGKTIDYYGDYNESIFDKSKSEVLSYMVREHKQLACAWNKIIKKNILIENNIRFIEGIIGEDIPWIVDLFEASKIIGAENSAFHIYRQGRTGSITKSAGKKGVYDLFESIKKISSVYENKGDEFSLAVMSFMAFEYAILLLSVSKQTDITNFDEIINYKWILKYATDKKTKFVKLICGFIGVKGTVAFMRKVIK